jgi:flavin reductase (DIM6/NTAB) family NADH-FMN oxidoreductase RutF
MIVDPEHASYKDCYKLMIGSVVPRPIAFVSTMSADGHLNLAPFSYFTAITSSPPTICFAPGRRGPDGTRKDTLVNIEATGEFVVNVVTEAIGAAMNETAADFPPDIDEFDVAGLTPAASRVVAPPRVAESPINMECKVYDILHIGPDGTGGGALVIGEIVMFHIADELHDDGRIKIHDLKPLGRLAGTEYTTLGSIISMKRKAYPPNNS